MMSTIDIGLSPRVCVPKTNVNFRGLRPVTVTYSKDFNLIRVIRPRSLILRRSLVVLCRSGEANKSHEEDFVTKVLKENPSQVEPRYLVGGKLYTLKERENLSKNPTVGIFQSLVKRLHLAEKSKDESSEDRHESGVKDDAVYLKDILREYKGKLYVPERIFGTELSEEEEFDKNFEALPKMSFQEFEKAMEKDKVKLLTSKEVKGVSYSNRHMDFIVDLKEIPGDKSLHRTKWYV